MSVITAFLYRLLVLKNKLEQVKSYKWFLFLIFVHLFYFSPTLIIYSFSTSNRDAIDEAIIQVRINAVQIPQEIYIKQVRVILNLHLSILIAWSVSYEELLKFLEISENRTIFRKPILYRCLIRS